MGSEFSDAQEINEALEDADDRIGDEQIRLPLINR
jgi:hypothetical protein